MIARVFGLSRYIGGQRLIEEHPGKCGSKSTNIDRSYAPLGSKRKSWTPIDDERSDQLFDLLVRQGKTMTFLAGADDDLDDDRQEFLRAFDEVDGHQFHEGETEETMDGVDQELRGSEIAARHTDLFLQTHFDKDKLDKSLLRCFYDARTAEEEQSVSIL